MLHVGSLCACCLLGATLALSGCEAMKRAIAPAPPGCQVTYAKGSELKLSAKVVLPKVINPSGASIDIGNVSYTGAQVQQMSEAMQRLDLARQNTCALISSDAFRQTSTAFKEQQLARLVSINDAIVKAANALELAKTPQDGVNQVMQAEAAAEGSGSLQPPGPPEPNASEPTGKSSSAEDFTGRNLASLSSRMAALEREIAGLKQPTTSRLHVSGFSPAGVALAAEQRLALVADVRQVFDRWPAERVPNVLVIGYADATGDQAYNVALALRRAEVVAELLRRHDFGRDFRTDVTSGGVYRRGADADARKVELLVSRAAQLYVLA